MATAARWLARAALVVAASSGAGMGVAAAPVEVRAAAGLLWFDGGRPNAQAQQAVELLAAAASHGLEPPDYAADALRRAVAAAMQGTLPQPEAVERLDRELTQAMQRYLGDLRHGRVDPRQLHHDYSVPRAAAIDTAALLRSALAAGRLDDAVRAAAPQLSQYQQLRDALVRYRVLAEHPAWRQPLPPLPPRSRSGAGTLPARQRAGDVPVPDRPAQGVPAQDQRVQTVPAAHRHTAGVPGTDSAWAGHDLLVQRLLALGDLVQPPAGAAVDEAALVDAVRSFQQRHGLDDDGQVGPATLAQLQIDPAARVRQIELTLERLRWTPLAQAPRMIVVNIPEFVLRAYEVRDGGISVQQEMKVIVGKALDTRTPLIDEEMRFIEFSPYWNVPPSIARAETVPRLRRDPAYFEREGFEFVAADGRVFTTSSAERLDAVLTGALRIRQRPGPRNALGDIKFVFPNRDNIYLHHTPAPQLFGRGRRDFSHGCIRVERPVALARFVLQGRPEWTEERIRQAMAAGTSATLRLAEPLPVLIAYATALVKQGRIHFFDDIYGHDRVLEAALRQHRPALAHDVDRSSNDSTVDHSPSQATPHQR